MLSVLASVVVFWSAGPELPILPGDAQQGQDLFQSQKCIMCHSVDGAGGNRASDLARPIGRGYTPAAMAALMWNHAPAMWAAMEKEGIPKPRLSRQHAADLFAFFGSARYFDPPGDAARGRRVFDAKRCRDCHGLASGVNPLAKPVSAWEPLSDPIALAAQMWNHAAQMRPEMARRSVPWPQFTSQELADLVVYLQNLARVRGWRNRLSATGGPAQASARTGEQLFHSKGCQSCHTGSRSHVGRYTGRSPTDFASAMWNHAPWMAEQPPTLTYAEMRHIVGYLWTLQVFDRPGNPARGRHVFTTKKCAACHANASSGAPGLASWNGRTHAFAMVEALWQHGPAMFQLVRKKQLPWPRFAAEEMRDLIAYLNGTAR